jgi:hypothetical protein
VRASGSCAPVPLRIRTNVIGALNLFRGRDKPFTGTAMEIAQAMTEMAAIGLVHERALRERDLLAEQLQATPNSRMVIEQAKGMSAEYLAVDDAFRLLRNYARDHNRKLSQVAVGVVERKIPSAALGRRPGGRPQRPAPCPRPPGRRRPVGYPGQRRPAPAYCGQRAEGAPPVTLFGCFSEN